MAKVSTKSRELLTLMAELAAINDVDAIIDKVLSQLTELYSEAKLTASEEGSLSLPLKLKGTVVAYISFDAMEIASPSARNDRKWSKEDKTELELFMTLVSLRVEELQLAMDLSASNERLLEQGKYMSQIFSTVSHELRTPLTNVIGFSELMLARDLDEGTRKQYLSEISRSARRLASLINDFLDLSRVEASGAIRLAEMEPADLDWIAERAWKDLNTELIFNRSSAEIDWQVAKSLPKVSADTDAMIRVFINLFSNAIKYGAGSKVICSIQVTKDLVQVKVEDKGIGIKADMLEAVFERFTRLDNDVTRETSGTGLGLWICQQIVEAHGGKIWCESEPNKGTSVYFTLPALR
jgi:signal transduction histidine kinase